MTIFTYGTSVYEPRINIVKDHLEIVTGYYEKRGCTLTAAQSSNSSHNPGRSHV
jgi:cation transport regulator ChaC